MNNNDILIRLRYALDIKDIDMIEIFKLGGMEVTEIEIKKILTKSLDSDDYDLEEERETTGESIPCTNKMLESFLNGFIIFKRGKKETKEGEPETPILSMISKKSVNNVLLKKLKIALELTSEDMLNILEQAGVSITKGELSAVFRKQGHKHYKACGDRYARNFLKGLAIVNRGTN